MFTDHTEDDCQIFDLDQMDDMSAEDVDRRYERTADFAARQIEADAQGVPR